MGFTSILVNPIGTIDFALTKINRIIENSIYNILEKRTIKKGSIMTKICFGCGAKLQSYDVERRVYPRR